MRSGLRTWIIGAFALSAAVATAAPNTDAREKYKAAAQLAADDDYEKALVVVDEGLAAAPKDLQLLGLRGNLLLKLRDYTSALAAYRAYLEAGATGANRREAQKIVDNLQAVTTTFIELELANGPAAIYLDSKTQGLFCTAAPACKKAMLPGEYRVIAERPGFDRWSGRITVEQSKTAKLAITLVEKPSLLTVRATQPGAQITVDGKPYSGPLTVAGGTHAVVVTLDGHARATIEAAAHEGKPVELDVTLAPLVAVKLAPRGAELFLDDKPVALDNGGLPLPAGDHVLVVRAKGFRTSRIEIPATRGADYALTVELVPVGALLELRNAPRGARVVVDGKTLGTAPLAEPVEIAPGSREIELRVDGYRPYRTTGTFSSDQRVQLEVGALRRDSRKRTYLVGATTGALLVTGAVFSFAALDREAAYADRARLAGVTADDPQLHDMKTSGERFSLFADVGLGIGLVGIGVTTYLFLREGRGDSEGSLRFDVGPTGALASGRF
ncbi:MAG: PEGA domain-containing protein [Deltaproteobacteria bacterium]|nr:PEGA domain-containing protein [Deltaproteobacteria bacterium]